MVLLYYRIKRGKYGFNIYISKIYLKLSPDWKLGKNIRIIVE